MPEVATAAATALLALWNDVDPTYEAEYNDWHANEHVPERLTVPGMLWASRWRRESPGNGPRYLTLYGLREAAVLDEAAYQRLLAEPTPASRRMRPLLRNLSRWVCTIEAMRQWPPSLHTSKWLVLQTMDDGDHPASEPPANTAPSAAATASLAARRLPQASGLPWLQTSQAETINGELLQAWTFPRMPEDGQQLAESLLYGQLPINVR